MQGCGAKFRALHEGEGAFVIPNPWDVGSAKILSALGFKALATTSAGLAFSLGVSEGAIPRDAVLQHCRDVVNATPLPVSADLEKGFGDSPESVHETILVAVATGLAGCSIEDHTGDRSKPIYEFDLALERIEAAVAATRALEAEFVLTARAESFLWGGTDLDEVIRRLQAFEEAGADVLYAPGLRDLDTIRAVCGALRKPVNVVMGLPGATFGLEELAEAGAKRISVGSALARHAYGGLIRAGREMAGQGSFGFADEAAGFAEIEKLIAQGAR
ncbi:MAG: isocitrate lyase/phosphoenolpyruvate mutase family protein [Pseudomonadota bacterium]